MLQLVGAGEHMGDNQRAKHGQPSQPGGKGNGKSQRGQGKEEGDQDSRFGQGGKGDQKQEDEDNQKGNQG